MFNCSRSYRPWDCMLTGSYNIHVHVHVQCTLFTYIMYMFRKGCETKTNTYCTMYICMYRLTHGFRKVNREEPVLCVNQCSPQDICKAYGHPSSLIIVVFLAVSKAGDASPLHTSYTPTYTCVRNIHVQCIYTWCL